MSAKIPPAMTPELARTMVPDFAVSKSQAPQSVGAERATQSLAPGHPNLPPNVLRVLLDLAAEGIPLDILQGSAETDGDAHKNAYIAAGDRNSAQSRVLSGLLRAVNDGRLSVDELNAFLTVFAIEPQVTRRALSGRGLDPELAGVVLKDNLYRLVNGRLVAATPILGPVVSRLWLETIAVAVLLGLVAAAAMRFS